MATHIPANPYTVSGPVPKTLHSIVAFLDVLGFKDEMRQAYKDGTAESLLKNLKSALTGAYASFSNEIPGLPPLNVNLWHVKAFTDNIVIGHPIRYPDAEGELGSVLLALREYEIAMVNAGFFVRGGVAIGQLYMDEEIVFGDSILEAYEAESKSARDPRIVLSPALEPYVQQQIGFYGNPADSPHNEVLLRDVDGQLFVNYLSTLLEEPPMSPHELKQLEQHKYAIEAKLAKYKGSPPLWSKYAWVGNYHNFICREEGGELLKYLINPALMGVAPSRLVQS